MILKLAKTLQHVVNASNKVGGLMRLWCVFVVSIRVWCGVTIKPRYYILGN